MIIVIVAYGNPHGESDKRETGTGVMTAVTMRASKASVVIRGS